MNIIIYTVLILIALYFLLRFFAAINSKKISQSIRILLFIGLMVIAVLFAVAGKFLQSPVRDDIPENINTQLIVELYSK